MLGTLRFTKLKNIQSIESTSPSQVGLKSLLISLLSHFKLATISYIPADFTITVNISADTSQISLTTSSPVFLYDKHLMLKVITPHNRLKVHLFFHINVHHSKEINPFLSHIQTNKQTGKIAILELNKIKCTTDVFLARTGAFS